MTNQMPAVPLEEGDATAVAYEVAAVLCDEDEKRRTAQKDAQETDFIQRERFRVGALQARLLAKEIRALAPDHTTAALEQIKQEARDEGEREFEADLKKVATVLKNRQPDKLPDALHIVNAILSTLSEPKENSDG